MVPQSRPRTCQSVFCSNDVLYYQGFFEASDLKLLLWYLQLKILTWRNEDIATDAISINGFEHYRPTDYKLAAWCPGRSSKAAPVDSVKWWADGDEPHYFIVSPKVRLGTSLTPGSDLESTFDIHLLCDVSVITSPRIPLKHLGCGNKCCWKMALYHEGGSPAKTNL